MHSKPEIIATWAETGKVHIWDAKEYLSALDVPPPHRLGNARPIQTFGGHTAEGFSMDWSPTVPGRLLTGDCDKNIHLWQPNQTTSWSIGNAFAGHTSSVEDLQWSPNEAEVFASCSCDRTIKIWDTRVNNKAGLSVEAHPCDVNVISWNRKVPYLMLSGADDGKFSIWDLRAFKSNSPAAHFDWHKGPITSVEWHPTEESVLLVSGEDHQITTWDMSLEKDADDIDIEVTEGVDDVPPQLLFSHMGQKEVKEVHWHPQISGCVVSTALTGFNIYKACNT